MQIARRPQEGRTWLIGPAEDLLFLANWTWPLVALLFVWLDRSGVMISVKLSAVYALYLVSTPHRWITLGLVALDKERLTRKGPTLLVVGGLTCLFFFGLWGWTRDVALLVLIQYVWNLWHIVAQHVGVARIYAVRAQPEKRSSGTEEKYLLRLLAFYAFWRVLSLGLADYAAVGFGPGWLERLSLPTGKYDALLLAVPAALLIRAASGFDRRLAGKYWYLASVCAHYGSMIIFCHFHMTVWALAVTMTNGLFHAVEYFAVVTWSVRPRANKEGAWLAAPLFRHWASTLLIFIFSIATLGLVVTSGHARAWILVNALVSYLHYAYDGVIWKMPDVVPAPAPRALETPA